MATRIPPDPPRTPSLEPHGTRSPLAGLLIGFFSWSLGLLAAGLLAGLLVVAVALAMAYPQLPDVSDLADYKPKLSMRVFSIEGKQIGEFGEERRNLTPFKDIPPVMVNAVLAIEDARFYQHGGLDYIGLLRASLANLGRAKSQGASTITMQVARNVYLSSEKTFTRKIYEILLTFKLEHLLSKDQILEIYLMARQLMFAQYGPEIYTRGLHVHTTIRAEDQEVAYQALRRGILDYELRQHYRGPEKFINLPANPAAAEDLIDDTLIDAGDKGDLLAAVVVEATPKKVRVARHNSEFIDITGDGLKPVQSGLSDKAPPNLKLRPGALVRIAKGAKGWEITQLPEVEGAFVAIDPRDGAIRSLVGGFDFEKNKFNHVTQAWRQPGSSFKPFIYSAALEKGFTPSTVVNDAPLFFDASVTGSQAWEPKNYDGKFEGAMSLRTGLAKSKNMVSIRVLQSIGAPYAQQWITRFGFEAERHPPYLTMALGAGSVTPLQMAVGYSVFANGGYRVNPYLITKVTDAMGKVLSQYTPIEQEESARAIEPRNAFLMTSLLQEVTRSGTAAKAQATLKRSDLYGKTGTTNDSMDAWFAGYQPTLTAITWIGYDTPRKLGERETGGGLSLPVWISYMQHALKNVPVQELPVPAGVMNEGGEWYFREFPRTSGVTNLGLDGKGAGELPAADEKRKILDLFKN
ncbi:MAG: penicillin-binding protein [Betaproteobacteria bacterium]|nr:penicillin-binding protein [Betaproteobacteria bacterium]